MHAFLRNEFQQFGREPPHEFTEHQRSLFCVFSGTCVKRLRDYLNTAPEYEQLREAARYRPSRVAQQAGAPQWGATAYGGEDGEGMEGVEGTAGQVPLPPPPAPAPVMPPGMVAGDTPVIIGTPGDDTPEPESEA